MRNGVRIRRLRVGVQAVMQDLRRFRGRAYKNGAKGFLTLAGDLLSRLLCMEWLVVLAAAPFLAFPTVRPRWTAGALAVLAVWWLLRWALRREPWPLTPFNGALLLFALMLPVGIVVSTTPEFTIPKAAGLILGLAVFRASALAITGRRSYAMALALFCLTGLGILVVGLLATEWSFKVSALTPITSRIPRLISRLPESQAEGLNPNQLAGVLAFYLPIPLAMMGGIRWKPRWVLGAFYAMGGMAFLGLTGGALLLTQSRSGWIGGLTGLLSLLILAAWTAQRRWGQVMGIALLLVIVTALAIGLHQVGLENAMRLVYEPGSQGEVESLIGSIRMDDRIEIWSRAVDAIRDFPYTGCGLGSFRRVVWVFYPLFRHRAGMDIAHAHNIFLQTALDLGIPGLVAYLALLLVAGAVCWRVARGGDPLARPLAIGLAAGLLALHTYGMTDALALGSKPAVVFWFALGLIAAMGRCGEWEA